MKKIIILLTILVLCAGCSAPPSSGYSSSSYSSRYSSSEYSSSSTSGYSSSSTTEYSPTYGSSPGGYNDNSYDYNDDWDEDDYSWLENLTYGDFVQLCRDDIIDGAVNVTYQQLARSANGMEGEYVKFKGEISQVLEESDGYYEYYTGLIDITYHPDEYFAYYSDTVVFAIPKEYVDIRPLVGDIVTIWGVSTGLTSYETVLGDIRTEPEIIAARVQFHNSNYGYGY